MNTRDGRWDKTPVTADGLYDIDIDVYHSQGCCDGPSISSTGLRAILRECPAKFFATSEFNPDRIVEPPKKSLDFGRAAHSLVLGEPEFLSKFIVSPYDDFRPKEARQWRDDQTKQIVKKEDLDIIEMMARAQRTSPQVARAFTAGRPEMSIIWRDKQTGVWVKTRPDWLPDFPALRFVTEYKTARTIEPRRLSQDAWAHGYEIQAAICLDGIEIVTGAKPLGIAHVVQEKDPPYLCDLRLFTSEQLAFGRFEYRRALQMFAHCLKTGLWAGYTDSPQYFDTPGWISNMMVNTDEYDPSKLNAAATAQAD